MSQHASLLDIARQVARGLSPSPGLRVLAVGGSTAQDRADEFSDLEIACYWDRAQEESARAAWIGRLNVIPGGQSTHREEGFWRGSDSFELDGVGVDVTSRTVGDVEATIDAVVKDFDPELRKSKLMRVLQGLKSLAGEPLIETWQARIADYPRQLQRSFLEAHLEFPPRGGIELHRIRRDLFMFHQSLSEYRYRIVLALLALNRTYLPSFKRLERTLESFTLKPDGLTTRFRATFAGQDVERAWEVTRGLIEEVFDLVDHHVPEVDTAKARATFNTIARIAVREACMPN